MSNAMSRSKSRWKGALLATVATAVVSPMAAKAQSLTIGLYADPLGGGTSPNAYANTGNGTPLSNAYIDPYDSDTLYVYGKVTGASAPSASYVDGLQFAYFNVNAAATLSNFGTVTATIAPAFNGGNFNGSSGNAGAGAQVGTIGTIGTTPGVVQGGTTLTALAKARSSSDVFNTGTSSGSNTIVSGNSVYFLLETLTYTPTSATVVAQPSGVGAPQSVQFNVSIPSATVTAPYVESNYFVGLPSTPVLSSPGASNTSVGAVAAAGNVTLTQALPGDITLDGTVNATDLNVLATNFNTQTSGWIHGDLNGDGLVNATDLNILATNFNTQLGGLPSALGASATAQIASAGGSSSVPEPTSLALIVAASAALLGRNRGSRRL